MAKEREIFPLRLGRERMNKIKNIYSTDNCENQTEFIEKAVDFYISYLTTNKEVSFLNPMLYSAMKASLKESENRQAGNLFRLAVEMSVIMNVIASALNVDEEQIKRIRSRCRKEVLQSHGTVAFESAIEYDRNNN